EARALLVGEDRERDWTSSVDAAVVQRADHLQGAQDPELPVVFTTSRYRVDMRAHDDRGQRRFSAPLAEDVAHLVDRHGTAGLTHPFLALSTIRFCPLCGALLVLERVPADHREQQVCSRCRFVYYLNPKVVAATIPERDGAVLLTRRSINPGRGLWTFPGGFV